MKANELADELKEWVDEFEDFAWLTKHETMLRQQQTEIDRLKFRIENSESLLEWENDGLKRQIQLFEDALHNAQEKIEALEDDKVLHDEAYLSQMKEIQDLKNFLKANELYLSYVEWRHTK